MRFAPLIRVSTERQEKQGESINTQKKQIIGYVEQLGGTIKKSDVGNIQGRSMPPLDRRERTLTSYWQTPQKISLIA